MSETTTGFHCPNSCESAKSTAKQWEKCGAEEKVRWAHDGKPPPCICSSATQSNALTRDGGAGKRWRPRPKAVWEPSTCSDYLFTVQEAGKVHCWQPLRQLSAKAPSGSKPLLTARVREKKAPGGNAVWRQDGEATKKREIEGKQKGL